MHVLLSVGLTSFPGIRLHHMFLLVYRDISAQNQRVGTIQGGSEARRYDGLVGLDSSV